MPVTYTYGKWTFGVLLGALLNEVKALVQIASFNGLGPDSTTYNTLVANYANNAIEDYLTENPAIGSSSTSNTTLSSSTNAYAVPTTMRREDIRKVYFSNTASDPVNDLRELSFVQRAGVSQIPPMIRNGTVTTPWPNQWAFSDDGASILVYPWPDASSTVIVVEYRQAPTWLTATDVATPAAVNIPEIPTRHQSVLATYMAAQMARLIPSAMPFADKLALQYFNPTGNPPGALQKAQKEIGSMIAAMKPDVAGARIKTGLIDTTGLYNFTNTWGYGTRSY